jgi:plasmid stabilization system protein ParE
MTVAFLPIAKTELDDAVEYYDLELPGLGQRFKEEVRSALKRISVFPEAWSLIRPGIRKCIMHKFPYNILYTIEEESIVVLALAHHHRNPEYWIERT